MGISSANQTIEDPEAEDDPVAGPVQFRPPLDGMDGCVTLETGTTETLSLIPAGCQSEPTILLGHVESEVLQLVK